jgi:Uma2 family endonuclease
VTSSHTVWKEEPLTFADSEPEPDVSVTLGSKKDYAASRPTTAELVVEIAVSSPILDREAAALYAEAGVKEYWIVLGSTRQVEVYCRPEGGRYLEVQLVGPAETLEPRSLPGVRVPVAELFV